MPKMSVGEMRAALQEYRAYIDIAIKALEQAQSVKGLDEAVAELAIALEDVGEGAARVDGDHS